MAQGCSVADGAVLQMVPWCKLLVGLHNTSAGHTGAEVLDQFHLGT